MPEGVIAEVRDGFATIEFTDPSLKAAALGRLLKIGGPRSIETITRDGPRRRYRVPEGNAQEAGLLDTVVDALQRGDQGTLGESDALQRGTSPIGTPTARASYVAATPSEEIHVGDHHVATTLVPKPEGSKGRRGRKPTPEPAEKIDAPPAGLSRPADF